MWMEKQSNEQLLVYPWLVVMDELRESIGAAVCNNQLCGRKQTFANFLSVVPPTMADFKVQMWHLWMQSSGEAQKRGSHHPIIVSPQEHKCKIIKKQCVLSTAFIFNTFVQNFWEFNSWLLLAPAYHGWIVE